ncbi:MAG: anhydro-N-acetylmuramic acid kinase [Candidatus Korobacteraceae bacterium]
MSGTSADGVDVAMVRLSGRRLRTRFELLAHGAFPYPAKVRKAVLQAMNAESIAVSTLARLNFLLAEIYADCVQRLQKRSGLNCELVGCHGQTLYHQGEAAPFLGRKIACTWQTGDGSVLAARLGVPVVSDFRPADMAAGGLGAPLVPFLDMLVFRHAKRGRIVLNLGGIGNLTAIPAAAEASQVRAFDTGPGNMVIDALSEKLFGLPFDKAGRLAARGSVLKAVLDEAMNAPFFRGSLRKPGPRTAGREQFGREYVGRFLQRCGDADGHDVLATATALTARSIGGAIRGLAKKDKYYDLFVSGGGTRNRTLMAMLRSEVEGIGIEVATTDAAGVPSQAKEAIAFALLAYQSWQGEPSNIPGATGAGREVILGKLSYA